MKKYHILLPLILVAAAVIVGATTIIVGLKGSSQGGVAEEPRGPGAEIATISVSADQSAAAAAAGARVVSWTTTNYPSDARVTINLIKKTSSEPATYEFVRTIASETTNDGSESWVPAKNESGDSYFVEVVCAGQQNVQGCRTTTTPAKAF